MLNEMDEYKPTQTHLGVNLKWSSGASSPSTASARQRLPQADTLLPMRR